MYFKRDSEINVVSLEVENNFTSEEKKLVDDAIGNTMTENFIG